MYVWPICSFTYYNHNKHRYFMVFLHDNWCAMCWTFFRRLVQIPRECRKILMSWGVRFKIHQWLTADCCYTGSGLSLSTNFEAMLFRNPTKRGSLNGFDIPLTATSPRRLRSCISFLSKCDGLPAGDKERPTAHEFGCWWEPPQTIFRCSRKGKHPLPVSPPI